MVETSQPAQPLSRKMTPWIWRGGASGHCSYHGQLQLAKKARPHPGLLLPRGEGRDRRLSQISLTRGSRPAQVKLPPLRWVDGRGEVELSSHLSNSKIKTSVQMRPLVIEGMDDWIVVLDCRNAGDGAL